MQDGECPSGAPADRSEGWGALDAVPTSPYPEEATSPVTFLSVRCDGVVMGYLQRLADNA